MAVDSGGSPKVGGAGSGGDTATSGKSRQGVRLVVVLLVCAAAIFWAGRVAWENRNPVASAARNLRAWDTDQRLAAIQEVQMLSLQNAKDGIPALIGALDDKDEKVRELAARAVGFVCSHQVRSNANAESVRQAAAALRAAMKDPAPGVRTESARSLLMLAGIGFTAPRRSASTEPEGKSPVDAQMIGEIVSELASDSDSGPRLLVWRTLGSAGTKRGIKMPEPLLNGVEKEPHESRKDMIKALGAYGSAVSAATPFLSKLLKEAVSNKEQGSEAEALAQALGRVAPGSPAAGEAAASLTAALQSQSPGTRTAAVKALAQLGPENAASALTQVQALEKDPDSKVREAAKSAVKSLTKAPK
jgi:HEAT repeat protein